MSIFNEPWKYNVVNRESGFMITIIIRGCIIKFDGKTFYKPAFGSDRDEYIIENVLKDHPRRAYKKIASEIDDNTKDLICDLLLKDPIKNKGWRNLVL